MATVQLSLPTCVLPGCSTIVGDPTQPCDGCRVELGYWIRESDRPGPTQAEMDERDAQYRQVMSDRARLIAEREAAADRQIAIEAGELRRPGQTCWLCEERRSCTKVGGRWECDKCKEIA